MGFEHTGWLRSYAASVLLGIAACGSAGQGAPEALHASQVRYELESDLSGVIPRDEGWELTTQLGYRVELQRARLVQYSAALVPCEEPEDALAALGRMLVPVARAGHPGDGTEATIAESATLDLLGQGVLAFGQRSFPLARYCKVHEVVAPALDGDGAGSSLLIEGRVLRDGEEDLALSVRSPLNYGALLDLSEVTLGELSGEHAEVRIARRVASMFRDVDFDALSEAERAGELISPAGVPETLQDQVGRQVLRNLVLDAEVTVRMQ